MPARPVADAVSRRTPPLCLPDLASIDSDPIESPRNADVLLTTPRPRQDFVRPMKLHRADRRHRRRDHGRGHRTGVRRRRSSGRDDRLDDDAHHTGSRDNRNWPRPQLLEQVDALADRTRGGARRLRGTTHYEALGDCDFIIEAATENEALKMPILRRINRVSESRRDSRDQHLVDLYRAVAATSTSPSLRRSAFLQSRFRHGSGRMVHGPQTDASTVDSSVALASELGKTPVLVKDSPGFVVNRLLCPMLNEAALGFRPRNRNRCRHRQRDEARLQPSHRSAGALRPHRPRRRARGDAGIPPRLQRSEISAAPLLEEMVKAGRLGRKSGRGLLHLRREKETMSNPGKQLSQVHDTTEKVAQVLQTRTKLALDHFSERVRKASDPQVATNALLPSQLAASGARYADRLRAALDPVLGHAAPARQQLHRARRAQGMPPVLHFDYEMIVDGRTLRAAGQLRAGAHHAAGRRDGRSEAAALRHHRSARRPRPRASAASRTIRRSASRCAPAIRSTS